MRRVAIFSPAAGGNVGHGFIYALRLGKYLSYQNETILFTINNPERIKDFRDAGINSITSQKFEPGLTNKKRFNKFSIFSELIYGVYRFYYNYYLIKEFFKRCEDYDIYHFFEFEYSALFLYSFFNRTKLAKSVIGLHIADFKWIKGRSPIINIYKSLLRIPVSWLVRHAGHTTTHGEVLREMLCENLSVCKNIVSSTHYGCDVLLPRISKKKARQIIELNDEKRIIALFFGVIRTDKGLLEILKNLNRITNEVVLLIAGSEGDIKKETIINLVKSENLESRVHLVIRYFEEDEIQNYFYASDFVLIPHKGDHIAFSGPLSLSVEYSRPVVASNIGEIGSFVRLNNIGSTFETDNWDNFVDVTNKFINNYSSYDQSIFTEVQIKNSWEDMSKIICKVYESINNE